MINIQLVSSTIQSLSIEHLSIEESKGKNEDDKSFDLTHSPVFLEDDDTLFANLFKLELEHPGQFILKIEYLSWFKTSEKMSNEFKTSSFISINAPAIAFPFLRSAISTITMISGFPAAILPTINFVAFNDHISKSSQIENSSELSK